MPDKGYYDNWNIDECDKDEYNAYQSRGFAVQLGEDFKPITNKNGEPTYGVRWVVQCYGTHIATFLLDIFHQYVSFVLMLCYVCL